MEPASLSILIGGYSALMATDDAFPTFTLRRANAAQYTAWSLFVYDASGTELWHKAGLSPQQAHVRYAGPALLLKSAYRVKAVLYEGETVLETAEASFETGFLGTPWQAKWIEPAQEPGLREKELSFHEHFMPRPEFLGGHTRLRPCMELKRDFHLDAVPARARLYATAHGVFELRINGQLPSRGVLAPETSSYEKRLYYETYDVTPLLRRGENTLETTIADGWWIGRIGLSGDSCQYGDKLAFLMQLEMHDHGETKLLVSDESFLCRRSDTDYADLFIGERRDFLRDPEPWERRCTAAAYTTDNLVAQPIPQIETLETLPARLFTTPEGDLMADFGACVAGVAEIAVSAKPGSEVELEFTETLSREGNFLRNILGRNKDQRDVFVCGREETRFCPRFTYHGFRYVRIGGVKREEITELFARVLGTPLARRGAFTCSDERLNRLEACIDRSMRSNMVSVPTDCPQREKVGWTGDILSFAPTGCFRYDLNGFLAAWLSNMREEQQTDGGIPVAVPNYPMQGKMQRAMGGGADTSSAWSDACVLVPWTLYQSYGDKRVLSDNLPMMERWLAHIQARCREMPENFNELSAPRRKWNDYLWTKGYHFGDWFTPSVVREENGVQKASALTRDMIGSSFYAITLEAFLNVLDALLEDSPDDETLLEKKLGYAALLAAVKTAVRECFIAPDGRIEPELQGLYVIALKAGIAEGELQKKVAARLAELIEENGDTLDTGFVSVPYLLDVLAQNGYRDMARKLLFQTKSPSWLYMVEHGATAIWENWEAVRPDGTVTTSSFDHYALGSVGDYIYRSIGGIRAAAPGYRSILFAPDIHCGLLHASCSLMTDYGMARCAWRWENGACRIELTVPQGAVGEFEGARLNAGEHVFVKEGERHGRS